MTSRGEQYVSVFITLVDIRRNHQDPKHQRSWDALPGFQWVQILTIWHPQKFHIFYTWKWMVWETNTLPSLRSVGESTYQTPGSIESWLKPWRKQSPPSRGLHYGRELCQTKIEAQTMTIYQPNKETHYLLVVEPPNWKVLRSSNFMISHGSGYEEKIIETTS